jgi:hypothetical protein
MNQIALDTAGKGNGRIDVRNFSLSYETIDGSVDAVTDTRIHVNPGEFVSIVGPMAKRSRGRAPSAAWCSSNIRCFRGRRSGKMLNSE